MIVRDPASASNTSILCIHWYAGRYEIVSEVLELSVCGAFELVVCGPVLVYLLSDALQQGKGFQSHLTHHTYTK